VRQYTAGYILATAWLLVSPTQYLGLYIPVDCRVQLQLFAVLHSSSKSGIRDDDRAVGLSG